MGIIVFSAIMEQMCAQLAVKEPIIYNYLILLQLKSHFKDKLTCHS